MTRRGVAAVIALVLASITIDAAAQSPGKVYRVGFLTIGAASVPVVSATLDGLVRGLERHGYSVGTNLLIESRFADGNADRLPGLVKELLGSGVDVIVTLSYPAARAVKEGTTTVPIVVAGASDPVETGLVASLSRPGGNITGISDMAAELSAKRLELLKTAVPSLNRVAILFNAKDAGMTARYRKASAAAATMGITVQSLGVREPDDFDAAFAAMIGEMPGGILMVTDVLTNLNRKRIIEFAAAHRVPAIFELEYLVREGGLMSYGVERSETSERVADLIDRILKGAKPADLPFEQPTRFRFVINRKTADALGLAIPESLYDRADEVIE
ncbi:MAG TPA: ABC transporter substrate-binding protein [Stellaceae bacterium]|jgi:putative ABC transport system substrate-binding protein|nr:ABC transporter substrate-binding protein [Stellaceae bacterium]